MTQNRSIRMIMVFFLLQMLFVLVIVPNDIIKQTVENEIDRSGVFVGPETTNWITRKARQIYHRSMVSSGLETVIEGHLLTTEAQRQREAQALGVHGVGDRWYDFVNSRIQVLYLIIFLIFFRVIAFAAWWPYLTIWIFASCCDGVLERKARKDSWRHASHVLHGMVIGGLKVAAFIILIILLSPFTINPIVYPAIGVVLGIMMSISISHMQKTL